MHSLGAAGFAVYVSTTLNGIYRSTDDGISWSLCPTQPQNSLVPVVGGIGMTVIAGSGGGISLSTDDGASWSLSDAGLHNGIVTSFTRQGPWTVAGTYDRGVVRTSDAGQTWEVLGPPGPTRYVTSVVEANGRMFAGTSSSGVFMSTDQGVTWEPRSGATNFAFIHSIIAVNDTIFVASEGGLHRSADWGATWDPLPLGFSPASVLSVLAFDTDLFAATYQGGVLKSTDRGESWATSNSGLPAAGAWRVGAGGGRLFVSLVNGELYESTDRGGSWTNADHPSSGWCQALLVVGQDLFTGTDNGAILQRSIGGGPWKDVSEGLLCAEVRALAVANGFLLAGTGGSAVWRRPLSEIVTGADDDVVVPHTAELHQNFPNPFNPSTTIEYSLPHAGDVTLAVYDLHGRAVATLVDRVEQAGRKAVTWKASGVAAGVYFYRLHVRFTGGQPFGESGQAPREFNEVKKILFLH
jgi:photosystem II stability/assembly factor-like uncharacterized protein